MCLDKKPALGDATTTECQKQNIQAILDLLEQSGQVESARTGQSASVLTALHLITSAMDGERAEPLLLSPLLQWNVAWSTQSVGGKKTLNLRSGWEVCRVGCRMSWKPHLFIFCFHPESGSLSFRDDKWLSCYLGNVLQHHGVTGTGATG